MNVPIADMLSRTTLLGVHDGTQPTLEQALAAHAATGTAIVADPTITHEVTGQAALCTAVSTAVRAFGAVTVVADGDTSLVAGPYRGRRIADMITSEGAHHADDLDGVPPHLPVLLLGDELSASSANSSRTALTLRATWTGWTAHVRPAGAPAGTGRRGNILAAIAAAATGVHEIFGAARERPGSDAGYRSTDLNLWHPGNDLDDGPDLTHAPAAWWLVGLGHLGQANAWVLSWLTYADPGDIQIILQDTDKAVHANHSTGVLTPRQPPGIRKTRLSAAVLDPLGYDTRLLERRLDATTRATADDIHVALLGVDNLSTRRIISNINWRLAIDTGLGTGPADFNAILLRRFPALTASQHVPGWTDPIPKPRPEPDTPTLAALKHDDPCGAVELAGAAVGAAFVGVTAACIAIAQSTRTARTGDGHDVINLHLQSGDVSHAPATQEVDVIPAPLRFTH